MFDKAFVNTEIRNNRYTNAELLTTRKHKFPNWQAVIRHSKVVNT